MARGECVARFELGLVGEEDQEFTEDFILSAPARLPAPPVPAALVKQRTAPIPLPAPTSTRRPIGFASAIRPPLGRVFDAGPELSFEAEALRSAPPGRVSVPPTPQPCPPGFVRI